MAWHEQGKGKRPAYLFKLKLNGWSCERRVIVTLTWFLESALRLRLQKSRSSVSGKPHPFPIHAPARPLGLSSDELKRFAQEEELRYDMQLRRMERMEPPIWRPW